MKSQNLDTSEENVKSKKCRNCDNITLGPSECSTCHAKMVERWISEQEKELGLRPFKKK